MAMSEMHPGLGYRIRAFARHEAEVREAEQTRDAYAGQALEEFCRAMPVGEGASEVMELGSDGFRDLALCLGVYVGGIDFKNARENGHRFRTILDFASATKEQAARFMDRFLMIRNWCGGYHCGPATDQGNEKEYYTIGRREDEHFFELKVWEDMTCRFSWNLPEQENEID